MFGDFDFKNLPFVAIGVLFLILIVATLAIVMLRRKFLRSEQGSVSPFTLDGLQKMHELGHISDEEYKNLRSKIIADMQK